MNKKLVVLGIGISGLGVANLAFNKGFKVFVSDIGAINQKIKKQLDNLKIFWEENTSEATCLNDANYLIKSPGVPDNSPTVLKAKYLEIPVISEIEFASIYTNAKIIGITGTNGKTSTTELTYHILKKSGINVGIAGNIGISFAQQVLDNCFDVYVLELSSFQLDDIVNFSPDIAVITNLSPDHLDRYKNNFESYIKSKLKISLNQNTTQFLIINANDLNLMNAIKKNSIKSKKYYYGYKIDGPSTTSLKKNKINIEHLNSKTMIPITSFPLKGRHNLLNAMAASTVASILNIDKNIIRKSLESFKSLPHRLEHVLKIHDVNYINDSKATNVNATFYALQTINSKGIWIAGGVDKGNDYGELIPLVQEKIKAIICLGKDNEKLIKVFQTIVNIIVETESIDEAVKIAHNIAERKETVILSPACASFDLFKNYEDRGDQFKKAVRNL
ncbi:MAG: UDP-N-acetylmuramoyl-L-alanine--D-glutamate ligase [Flavobacteriaceae bacterium]|jgi:UDP-N-acetylmuramoylalanine--D-glutamate ligase|nr:UDP-N-acetylmuramoyl-L-alanine--D-glutamate ligase [Flavobacteriaceae bacterium]|tara:strand:- start:312 stop:1649 length:1338 start_codon:yes stop_codon:yes gene_type:complete